MLSHTERPSFLYAIDESATPPPDTSQDSSTNEEKASSGKLLTSEEVSRIASSEAKKAKAKAEAAYLERLGVSSLDEAVSRLSALREKEESEKSEAQKLAEKLAEMQRQLESERQARAQVEQLRLEEKRDNALKALLSNAHDPDGVLIILKAKYANEISALLSDNGQVDSAAAAKLVSDYKAGNAYQFKGDSKGSPSNNDGRLIKPPAQTEKEIEAEIRKKLRF